MKLNSAILVAAVVLTIGLIFEQTALWVPASVLVAGTVDLFTRSWVRSDRIGSARYLSVLLKLVFALTGFYAMIGQFVCAGVVVWWIFT